MLTLHIMDVAKKDTLDKEYVSVCSANPHKSNLKNKKKFENFQTISASKG